MKRWWRLAVLLIGLAVLGGSISVAQAAAENDWLCLPFERVGPILASAKEEDLVQLFGVEQVQRRTIYVAEGTEKRDVSVIYPYSANEVILFWQDNQYGQRLSHAWMKKEGSSWRTAENITVGTPVAELNRLNGQPFRIVGFGWDYGGYIPVRQEGKLIQQKGLCLRLAPTRQLPRQYYGDGVKVFSADPELLPDAVRVVSLEVTLNEK
nr:hypothetical protein [uncultured Anaeromusa sp.]